MTPISARCKIEMLGGLRVQIGERTLTRFRTQKTGGLLACLAYRAQPLTREILIEALWPEGGPEAGRQSLSQALTSLRRELEIGPPSANGTTDLTSGQLLRADRYHVHLNFDLVTTDTGAFEVALRAAEQYAGATEAMEARRKAVASYRGELLAGYDAEQIDPQQTWLMAERERLAGLYRGALQQLARTLAESGDFDGALAYAHQRLRADLFCETAHLDLMRLYVAAGRPAAALEQYRELEALLKTEMGSAPSSPLRDLARQLLARLSAPTRPPRETPPDLPPRWTRFFGRETELETLLAWLLPDQQDEATGQDANSAPNPYTAPGPSRNRAGRLITLTRTGGSGKTRLALEAAERLRARFGGAVWFVALADIADPTLVAGAIRDALQLARSHPQPLEQVAASLARQPALLVLDNLEQLGLDGAAVARTLLERVPSLTCLVTSRRALGLAGERALPVRPLPTPDAAQNLEELGRVASVQLFVDRALTANPDFRLTARNAPDVAEVCRRLEGLPLAIELAAARAQSLTPAQMRERLAQGFDLLAQKTGPNASAKEARHRSLRATLEWSYALLSPPLQGFFARLSVFRGGFAPEAARSVCKEPAAPDYLTLLQGHSLLLTDASGPEMRFRLLETLREFGQEKLGDEARAGLERAHAACCYALVETAEPFLTGPEQGAWLARLETEHDNLRLALDWHARNADLPGVAETGLRMTKRLARFWIVRGHQAEGWRRLQTALGLAAPWGRTPAYAAALNDAGAMASDLGDYAAALRLGEESLALAREHGDRERIASALNNLGLVFWDQCRYEQAREHLEASLQIARERDDARAIAIGLGNLALVHHDLADYETARTLHTQSLTLRRKIGDRRGIAYALSNLGNVASFQGDFAASRTLHRQSLAIRRAIGHQEGIATSLYALGDLALEQGQTARAIPLLTESLRMRYAQGDRAASIYSLESLAIAGQRQGYFEVAAQWSGAAEAMRETLGCPLPPAERPRWQRSHDLTRAALGEQAFAAAWQTGRALDWEAVVTQALAVARNFAVQVS